MEPTIYKPSIYNGAGIYKLGGGGGGGVGIFIKDVNGLNYRLYNYISTKEKEGLAILYTDINNNIDYTDKFIYQIQLNQFSGGEAYKALLTRYATIDGQNVVFSDGFGIKLNYYPYDHFSILGANVAGPRIGNDYEKHFSNCDIVNGRIYELKITNGSIVFNPPLTAISDTDPNYNNVVLNRLRLLGKDDVHDSDGCFEYPFYSLIIKDNLDKVKYNYKPAIRENDSKIGFFDLANLIFYPSTYSDNDLQYIEMN